MVPRKVALEIRAHDAQLARFVVVREEREGFGAEARSAPRTVLKGDWRRLALWIGLELAHLSARGVGAPVAPLSEDVGRRGLSHPEPDLEWPPPVPSDVFPAFELERAHQSRCARELIKREQSQRVTHDHAHSGAGDAPLASVAQPSQHHRESCEGEIRLGLAATGWEEQQVDRLTVRVKRVGKAREI